MSTGSTSTGHPASVDEFNPFQAMAQRFHVAADHLGLDQGLRDVLRTPDRELTVAIPIVMDDGRLRTFTGYRVQHNQGLGPFMGPLRIAGSIELDEVRYTGRTLYVSLSLLRVLEQDEADAVLAHELAHFHGGHTAVSASLVPMQAR